jgi:hypothetical protein
MMPFQPEWSLSMRDYGETIYQTEKQLLQTQLLGAALWVFVILMAILLREYAPGLVPLCRWLLPAIGLPGVAGALVIQHRYDQVFDYEPTTWRGKQVNGKHVRTRVKLLRNGFGVLLLVGVTLLIWQ